ncbi:MAG: ATPase, T2SS/T4P/T4SS family, partial [Planctomycetota bacterium]
KYKCPLQTQGTKTGERVVLTLAGGTEKKFKTYADLGMRSKVADEWSDVMAESTGLIVFSAMPEGGLTTLTDVSLQETDRLMRDFISIEEKSAPELEMENIEQVFYDASAGESPGTLMPKLIRKYPDVYVVRDMVDADSGKALMDQAGEGKLIITSTPARDAADALVRVCQHAPRKQVAETAIGSISGRLIRKLCTECRIGFEPSPDLLKKLGIPAGKVEQLYREPKEEEIDKPCKACGGIGYRGRTAMYEVLLPDDTVRETLIKKPKSDVVRKAARVGGMRTFQEEGILLVAKGATSLSELQRVLKT